MADRGLLIVFLVLQGLEKERLEERFLRVLKPISILCIDDDTRTTSWRSGRC